MALGQDRGEFPRAHYAVVSEKTMIDWNWNKTKASSPSVTWRGTDKGDSLPFNTMTLTSTLSLSDSEQESSLLPRQLEDANGGCGACRLSDACADRRHSLPDFLW